MEDKRTKTLEALDAFIQNQQALLVRTQSDIQRLRDLRERASSPSALPDVQRELVQEPSYLRLSSQIDCVGSLPQDISWDLFRSLDARPLTLISSSIPQTHIPLPTSSRPPSTLQAYVRAQRAALLDPIRSSLEVSPPSSPAPSPAVIRQSPHFTRRKPYGDHRRPRGPGGVFVRRDMADESLEVDIGQNGTDAAEARSIDASPPAVDTASSALAQAQSSGELILHTSAAISTARTRKPSARAATASTGESPIPSKRGRRKSSVSSPITSFQMSRARQRISIKSDPERTPGAQMEAGLDQGSEAEPDALGSDGDDGDVKSLKNESTGKKVKARPETYKQAWSVEEQHLLEHLLKEIPDGEKNRWQKISRAMKGKRTPRQVASRVQKYFEKLKKFGVDVP